MLLVTFPEMPSENPKLIPFREAVLALIQSVAAGRPVQYDATGVQTATAFGELWRFSRCRDHTGSNDTLKEFTDLHALAQVIGILKRAQAAGKPLSDYCDNPLLNQRLVPLNVRPSDREAAVYIASWVLERQLEPPQGDLRAWFVKVILS
ncbi:MAG TPA: hypothetical protein VFT87_06045 [Candidatus Saccharimonadales bacterium]|nr:hypothetical protein [Candidatus Saccharimonadales bacterium]